MSNFYPLAKEIANDVKDNSKVSIIFHLKNGDSRFFFYNQSYAFRQSTTHCTKQFTTSTIANRINNEWCQTLSDDIGVEKISIAKYSG